MDFKTAKVRFEHKYIKMTAMGGRVEWSEQYQQYVGKPGDPENEKNAATLNLCFNVWMAAIESVKIDCPVGFCAGAEHEGNLILLWQYAAKTRDDVERKIITKARHEGFRGNINERLSELGWSIIQFSAVES